MTFRPAPPGTGMVFIRVDLPGRPSITSHPNRLCQRMRRTALAATVAGVEVEVHTTEHFLAAATGLGLDNLFIELDAVEFPGLDGSALDFANCLRGAGIVEQAVARPYFDVTEAVAVSDGKSSIVALPYRHGLKITYSLDDHGGALGGPQMVEVELTEESFVREIAPARTFCMAKEVEMLRALGLGKGATTQNTCVYDGTRIIDNELRFKDEAARHKILDLIGDLAHATQAPQLPPHRGAHRPPAEHAAGPGAQPPHRGRREARRRLRRRAHPRAAAAPLPVPAGRPDRRVRGRQAHHRPQERHHQRAVLPGPLPRPPGDARRCCSSRRWPRSAR